MARIRLEEHGVYVIGEWLGDEPDGMTPIMSPYVKIGVARNVTSRMAQLQTGNPNTLILLAWTTYPSRSKAFAVERRAKAEMAEGRRSGEWFATDGETAANVIEYVS